MTIVLRFWRQKAAFGTPGALYTAKTFIASRRNAARCLKTKWKRGGIMTKRTLIILTLIGVYIIGAFSLAFALGDGNHRKGKYLFRKHCRECHIEEGKAKVLEPLTFTMEEWTKKFQPEAWKEYACADEWAKLSEEDINDIYTYLHKFAKDSPTPAKCK
jgi:mono/diheme cytochrome c family protein